MHQMLPLWSIQKHLHAALLSGNIFWFPFYASVKLIEIYFMLNILITQKWFSLSLYLCGIVLYLSVVVSCFFIHFAHSSTRKECIFIVFINHAHDIGSLIFRLTFSYAMLAIDQTSPKTKLIRIVCERHSRFGNLSHIFFCCSLSASLNSVPKMLAAWYFVQLLVQCENKMLLHGKAKWSHVVHSNQIFYTC